MIKLIVDLIYQNSYVNLLISNRYISTLSKQISKLDLNLKCKIYILTMDSNRLEKEIKKEKIEKLEKKL